MSKHRARLDAIQRKLRAKGQDATCLECARREREFQTQRGNWRGLGMSTEPIDVAAVAAVLAPGQAARLEVGTCATCGAEYALDGSGIIVQTFDAYAEVGVDLATIDFDDDIFTDIEPEDGEAERNDYDRGVSLYDADDKF